MMCLSVSDGFLLMYLNLDLPGHLQVFSPEYNQSDQQQSNQEDTEDGQHGDYHDIGVHLRHCTHRKWLSVIQFRSTDISGLFCFSLSVDNAGFFQTQVKEPGVLEREKNLPQQIKGEFEQLLLLDSFWHFCSALACSDLLLFSFSVDTYNTRDNGEGNTKYRYSSSSMSPKHISTLKLFLNNNQCFF